jgi:serine/threonine protein kinase
MVLEYANEGNLREYLMNEKWRDLRKKDSLEWKDKINMALDITRGLKCLHSKDIIHRDLVNELFYFYNTFFNVLFLLVILIITFIALKKHISE